MLNLKHLRFSSTSIACRVTNSVSGAGAGTVAEQGVGQAGDLNGESDMDNEQTHECAACGGTGDKFEHAYAKAGCNCPACGGLVCLICLGAGRISDRMPVADAMADAETVRRIVEPYAVTEINGPVVDLYNAAARAAFRAVPGLRGR